MATKKKTSRNRARGRRVAIGRIAGVAALVLLLALYYRPLRSYLDARAALAERSAEVDVLRAKKRALERRLETASTEQQLVRRARELALVRPGERLYIVKGIDEWRATNATVEDDG
jgi:cell division protein FtsB